MNLKHVLATSVMICVVGATFLSCGKDPEPVPVKGDFKASWTENGNGTTYTCTGSLFSIKNRILTLYAVPGVGATRNLSLYLADTVKNSYPIGASGSGKTFALIIGLNGPEGTMFFNSTSGSLTITQKQPTWISGTFEVNGNATAGSLQSLKGSFEYVNISR